MNKFQSKEIMNRWASKFYFFCLIFLLILPIPGGLILQKAGVISNLSENRVLSPFPEIAPSLGAIRSFPDGFTAFFMDHLPFKTPLVRLSGMLDYYVFKSSASDSVIVGREGFLFYRGSQVNDEHPVEDYQGTNLFEANELSQLAASLTQVKESLKARGTEFVLFLVPNKERAYYEYMPEGFGAPAASCRLEQLTAYLRDNTDLTVVTPLEAIRDYHQNNPEDTLYYRYDTHWNRLGAYVATASLASVLDITMPGLNTLERQSLDSLSGDLASQIGLGGILKDEPLYMPVGFSPAVTEFAPLEGADGFYGGAWGAGVQMKNLLLVGDSFSTLVYPYIGYYFVNSLSVNYYDYDKSYLDRVQPDVFVLEVVERYLENLERFTLENGVERILE